ncbi:serine hydrolase domain-containing protein [Reyranella sp.]|uniref:serine hydrolase domain-containing protein n=1 Tax=Reyranella sp. TaxID=1929291 RepID=UPI003BA85F15
MDTLTADRRGAAADFPLPAADLESLGFRRQQIDRLVALIERHIEEGHYPGCQIALARHGRLALFRSFGDAATEPDRRAAADDTLWLLYSNTKVVTAVALWVLAERGLFSFSDRVAEHVPEFARHAKGDITILQTITHQAGFPNAVVPKPAWADHKRLREVVCNFALEWSPGSKVHYHGLSAHWTLGVLIEALTGQDFRDVIRETVAEPLGLGRELFVGLPEAEFARAADMHEPVPRGRGQGRGMRRDADANSPEWRKGGAPGGAGYGTARAMAALYQMMLQGGTLGGTRLVSPRTLQYAIRNHTGDRVDAFMGMPMHRGLGPHLRGTTANVRGLGGLAHPGVFGHGGVGTSYCWGDPESGVSFAYITNNRIPDPWHSRRLDLVANLVHAAILPDGPAS